jgi:hypothetical protein
MSILSLSKQPLVGCHIWNRYWCMPRTSMTFANHDLCMNTQHAWPYECCHISTQLKSPWKVMRLGSILSVWMVCGGMLLGSAPAPHIPKVPKRFHSQQSHKLFMSVEDPASILYASHIRKACPEGTLLLIWHNDHRVQSDWKQWWSQGLCNSLAVLSMQQVSLNRCPHSELSYSTNYSSSRTWLVTCHFLYNSHFVHLHYRLFQPLMMLIWVKRFWLHCGEKSKVGFMILHSLVSIIVPF